MITFARFLVFAAGTCFPECSYFGTCVDCTELHGGILQPPWIWDLSKGIQSELNNNKTFHDPVIQAKGKWDSKSTPQTFSIWLKVVMKR